MKNLSNIREIRLRNGKGMRVNVGGVWYWVGRNCLVADSSGAVQFGEVCDDFVKKACNQSVYAYEKMLAQGYFTFADGTRVGVCGVASGSGVFQKYTSLCVRTARHFDCVGQTFDSSLVVVGAPRSGKTTFLRDLAWKLSRSQNVVVVDERGEISECNGFEQRSCCDVFRYTSKQYAFEVAVRTMSPDWIVCDELAREDLPYLDSVVASGVKLAASVHASDLQQLKNRLGKQLEFFSTAVFLQKDTFLQSIVKLDNLH